MYDWLLAVNWKNEFGSWNGYMKLWRLLLQHPDEGIRLDVLDVNKAGSIHRRLFLYSQAPFFLCYFAVMNYSVIMVGILIVLQVSVQPVTITLLGLAKKDPYKNTGESGQRETWRLHKAESQTRNNTLKISNSQQHGDRPGVAEHQWQYRRVGEFVVPASPFLWSSQVFTILYSLNMHTDASSPAAPCIQKAQRAALSPIAH